MPKINRKIAVSLLLCLLLTMPIFANINVHSAPPYPTTLRVDPPSQEVQVESFFDVFVYVDSFFDVYYFGVSLSYDTSKIDALDVTACPPFKVTFKMIDDTSGYVVIEGAGGPINGTAKLAAFRFHCTGAGLSPMTIGEAYLANARGEYIPIDVVGNGKVSQTTWYLKPSYADYAPSGVPDFDQKQWGLQMWKNPFPPAGTWSYCGPVAVANSLWWLDSEYEPNPKPPTTANDGFPLVQTYIPGKDDHNPLNVPYLVEDLALLMDTNGLRYGHTHCGTEVHEMTMGLNEYIHRQGLDWKLYVHLQQAPDFFWIEDEIKKCQDVVLLLGFWQTGDGVNYWRVGGHYVTCAGVDSKDMMLAVSDPYIDFAEMGGLGIVLPPPPHPHTGPPETLHNDAAYVSHDFYPIGTSPSPGGHFGFYDYPAEYVIDNFGSCQNTPDEFIQLDGPYVPTLPIYTEIEYAVVTSCKTGLVAAGSEDTNVYCWDFNGNLQWTWATTAPVISVAFDNDAKYLVSGSRSLPQGPGVLSFFDAKAVSNGGLNMPLWATPLPISESYDGGFAGTESKSVDTKYNYYNLYNVVAAATTAGLFLFNQWGNVIWIYYDRSPETIVRISQDGNYIICADYNTGFIHYFSHLTDGVPGWGPNDGVPVWTACGGLNELYAFWVAISGNGDYVAASVYPNPVMYNPMMSAVTLFDRTGSIVWFWILNKGGYVRVDMPCSGESVVSVNDDPSDGVGCDLTYWSDGGNGWDGGDASPVWSYSTGNLLTDFYTVAISENGDNIATGAVAPTNNYLLKNDGTIRQIVGLMPGAVQSTDLTFTGKYGASVDNAGAIWFYSEAAGFIWGAMPTQAPFHCVAVSKLYPCMFPYPNHDVAVTNVHTCKTVLCRGLKANVTVTVANLGDFAETTTVSLCMQNGTNFYVVGTKTVSLSVGETKVLIFTIDATGMQKGRYVLFAKTSIVYNEINVYDNSYSDNYLIISCEGDIVYSHLVDIYDVTYVCVCYNAKPGDPNWSCDADLVEPYGLIDIYDVTYICICYDNAGC